MKRALYALAPAVLMVLALAAPASAATQVTHYTYSGRTAEAYWYEYSATSSSWCTIIASKHRAGDVYLYFGYGTSSFDPETGALISSTDTQANLTSGFFYTISAGLTNASVKATGLPATTTVYDANLNPTSSQTTVDLNVAWTGQGTVFRTVVNGTWGSPGVVRITAHDSGSFRNATAAGTINGQTIMGQPVEAHLANVTNGRVDVFIGS